VQTAHRGDQPPEDPVSSQLKEAGVPAELVKIAGAPHAFWNGEQWFSTTMELTAKHFRTYLGN
jgi:acetyl esterase/lipase